MKKKAAPYTNLTTAALEAVHQRFPEEEIKAVYIRLIRKPQEENIIKVQTTDNTYYILNQNWTGENYWREMD